MPPAIDPPQYPPASFIDPATLMQIASLELRAKAVVEGFLTGLHRSPYHGFSVEFTEYRQYVPGDDPRYLDWKLYGRSDRYYVKRFEDETNLRCYLVLDQSRSMTFGTLGYTKADYARTLAATFGYFLTSQRDAVGLMSFSDVIEEYMPARYRPGWLRRLIVAMDRPGSGAATDLSKVLEEVTLRASKRGLVCLISDFLTDVQELGRRLAYLRSGGHEVAVFQILDPAELKFEFPEPALFEDLETGEQLYVDPEAAREDYLRRLNAHLDSVDRTCQGLGVQSSRLATDTPLELALADFLKLRNQVSGARL
ncbi:MAG: DUF58 domain-containing protein [Planctomycetaceae bacterium]|nr:DUF58 domain-containing protein [Planctomycetaceae bacterium]